MLGLLFFFVILYIIWWIFFSKRTTAENSKESKPLTPLQIPQFFILGLVSIILGYNVFLYDTWTYLQPPILGIGGFYLSFLGAVIFSYSKKRDIKFWFVTIVGAIASLGLMYRANGFVQSVNVGTMAITTLLLVLMNTYDQVFWKGFWLLRNALGLIPKTFSQIGRVLSNPSSKDKKSISITGIIKTTGITALVLVVFANLLSQADPVFAEIIKEIREQALGRVVASLVIAFVMLVIFTMRKKADKENTWYLKWLSLGDIFFPLLATIALFAVFIVVQVRYLFGSHDLLTAFDLTYSEYVRKGFIELLTTSFFGGFFAYVAIFKNKVLADNKRKKEMAIAIIILIAELLFILASAFKRDLMYVDVYGLTRVRIVGGIFLVWLASVLISLAVMAVNKLKETKFFYFLAIASSLVVLSLNAINVDQWVINGSPEHHDYKDWFYTNNLSGDGANGWLASIPAIEEDFNQIAQKTELTDVEKSRLAGNKLALISLQEKRVELYRRFGSEEWVLDNCQNTTYCNKEIRTVYSYEKDKDEEEIEINPEVQKLRKWQHANYGDHQAYQLVAANEGLFFDKIDELVEKIELYQLENQIDLYEQENRLLHEFNYPFISIGLRYYPKRLSSYTSPRKVGEKFDQVQLQLMEKNDITVKSMIDGIGNCQNNAQYQLSAMMYKSSSSYQGAGYDGYVIWDDSMSSTFGSMSIYVKENNPLAKELKAKGAEPFFAKLTLKATDDLFCRYEIVEFKEIKQLQ